MKAYLRILTILFLSKCNIISQNNIEYKFIVRDKVMIDTTSDFYNYKTNEFNITRVNLNDSMFKEIGLFGKTLRLKKPIVFKIRGDKWYIFSKKNIPFFPFDNNKCILLEGKKYIFENVQKEEVNNISCFVFTLRQQGISISNNIKYYFNYKYGVFMVNVDGVDFIRNDINY